MTTEQPNLQRRLRRRSDERVIAGVASGLGDYFNIDPLLIRIALVASIVFGGMGIFLYVAAWLLMPDETTGRSIAEHILRRSGPLVAIIGALLVLSGIGVFFGVLGEVSTRSGGFFGLVLAIAVIAVGAMLLRRNGPDAAGAAPNAATVTGPDQPTEPVAVVGAPAVGSGAPAPAVTVRRRARPRSPLGWYVLGAVLIGIGVLAALANVSGAAVEPAHFFALTLGIIGLGLVIGTWWGHAHWLIVLGVLLLPFAWAASLIDVPLGGGWGQHRYGPMSAAELHDEYQLAGGQIRLDLTRMETTDEPIDLTATVAMGEVLVLLPEDAGVELDAAVGGGQLRILGDFQSGTQLTDRYVMDGDGQQFVLDLEAGLGSVRVETRQTEGRSR